MNKKIRLDKFLSHAIALSRKAVKEQLKKGDVLVNGILMKDGSLQLDPEKDTVTVSGKIIKENAFCYLMLHKPAGYLSATRDAHALTVMALLPPALKKQGLFIVGRLDKDTEGFLLLTNDGPFAHQILSPKKEIKKIYFAKIQGTIHADDISLFQTGIPLEDGYRCKSAELTVVKAGDISEIELTISEGKFHQVKRMFQAIGKPVLYLKRVQIGNLPLDPDLPLGQSKELTPAECKHLLQETK